MRLVSDEPPAPASSSITPQTVATVIYTSGTTGILP